MAPGRALPISNLESNQGEAVDLFFSFCLAVPCSSKQTLLFLWETQFFFFLSLSLLSQHLFLFPPFSFFFPCNIYLCRHVYSHPELMEVSFKVAEDKRTREGICCPTAWGCHELSFLLSHSYGTRNPSARTDKCIFFPESQMVHTGIFLF